ncbi:MAG: OmpA family protein [Bacteroidia bacterium]|nr:OmpA family protein [Bacteroidia bacterium]
MVFTSRRENTTGGKVDFSDNIFFEDIYISTYDNGQWSSPQNLPINRKYHDAGAAVSSDGRELYLYHDDKKTKGDLYVSTYNPADDSWTKPKKLNDNVNSKYQETSLSLSADGTTIYFASDRPGGLGGLDIYMSKKDANGEWGPAANLGKPINTEYDDDAPFLTFDSKTFYFSSRGHNSMGGYDVFKSESVGTDQWGEPVNMGYPINGPDDDAHLVLTYDNKKGYYVSDAPDGYGYEDIYTLSAPKETLVRLDKKGLTITEPQLAIRNTGGQDTTSVPEPEFAFRVLFDFDRSYLSPVAKGSIDQLFAYLKDYEKIRIEIGGHTDNVGNYTYNQLLSQQRAKVVANYLIEKGIDANRIEVKGYSFDKPAVPNTNPTNRALNRRADYIILEGQK